MPAEPLVAPGEIEVAAAHRGCRVDVTELLSTVDDYRTQDVRLIKSPDDPLNGSPHAEVAHGGKVKPVAARARESLAEQIDQFIRDELTGQDRVANDHLRDSASRTLSLGGNDRGVRRPV